MIKQNKNQRYRTKKYTAITLCAVLSLNLGACGKSSETQKPVVTELNDLLASNEHPCNTALLTVGNDLILSKNHALSITSMPALVEESDGDETLTQIQTSTAPLMITGVLEYEDRPAHIRFNAIQLPLKDSNDDNVCQISYQLDYQFNEPCMSIREDAFKKWNQISTVNNSFGQTRQFVHKRKPFKKAYLTDLERNTVCMVSVNHLFTLPSIAK